MKEKKKVVRNFSIIGLNFLISTLPVPLCSLLILHSLSFFGEFLAHETFYFSIIEERKQDEKILIHYFTPEKLLIKTFFSSFSLAKENCNLNFLCFTLLCPAGDFLYIQL